MIMMLMRILGTTDEDDDDGDLRYNDVWRRGEKNHSGEDCVPGQTDQAKSENRSQFWQYWNQATFFRFVEAFSDKSPFHHLRRSNCPKCAISPLALLAVLSSLTYFSYNSIFLSFWGRGKTTSSATM